MPKVVRAVLSLALLVVVYSSVLVLSSVQAAGEDSGLLPDWTLGALGVWAGALLLVSVANMVNAYLGRNEGSASGLALWGMVLKICMIPFYLFGFFGGALISIGLAVVPGLFILIPLQVAVMAAVGFAPLLATSSYCIAAAVRAQREGAIEHGTMISLIVLHLLFVTDLIASVVLYTKLCRAMWSVSDSPIGTRL